MNEYTIRADECSSTMSMSFDVACYSELGSVAHPIVEPACGWYDVSCWGGVQATPGYRILEGKDDALQVNRRRQRYIRTHDVCNVVSAASGDPSAVVG